MKIRIYGFEWFLGKNITFDQFIEFLINNTSGKLIHNRIFGLTERDAYFVGLFLTIKDIKAFCQLKKEEDRFIITPKLLEDQTKITDFNYFLITKKTGRGLYQYYHQSAAPNTFCAFCKKEYDKLKKELIDAEVNKLESPTEYQKRKIRKRYQGSLRYATLLKPDSFENYIRTLKKVSSFEFEYSTLSPVMSAFRPLTPYTKRASHKVFFHNQSSTMQAIKDGIINIVRQGLRRGRVKGVDPEGNEVTYKLINDYNTIAEYEYDDVVPTIRIDSQKIEKSIKESYLINEMIRIARSPSGKALLDTPSR